MQNIFVIGAGKSSGALIEYLSKLTTQHKFTLTVADVNEENLQTLSTQNLNFQALKINGVDDEKVLSAIAQSALVISMLPASMHIAIAQKCLQAAKHLITPSYISPEMQTLHQEAKKAGLLFLNEMGLDPGIDHMSACEMIQKVQTQGGSIESFKSHCGGLVAKESNNNPWGYKFSWNPRNVVLAGQGADFIRWRENGSTKLLPYHRLFASTATIQIENEKFDSYPNRDSLAFIEPYNLLNAQTVYRGTLRYHGFCQAWQMLVQLGVCDNNSLIEMEENETNASFFSKFLRGSSAENIEEIAAQTLNTSIQDKSFQKLKWLELFEKKKLPVSGKQTAALVLQKILEEKWQLKPGDKDRVVMVHEMVYEINGTKRLLTATLDLSGNERHTAMAATVGLPIGIAAKMILLNQTQLTGVLRPVMKEIYEPVLQTLQQMGIDFKQHEKML
jgi:saccharopine dehydrogenase-like NADP-dependent oxidoreductase